MKKVIVTILLASLTFSMAACCSAAASTDDSSAETVSAQYEIGDIILTDGSVKKETDLKTVDSNNVPIAVIAGFQGDGTAFGVGVHRSGTPLQWKEDDAENFPAFDFVDNYAETYDLTGDYASGWYMPDIDELCSIYENREDIDNSLECIYGLDNRLAMDGLDTNWYWSSTQSDLEDDYAWFVHYFNGYAGECPKNFTNVHVLTVRVFTEKN